MATPAVEAPPAPTLTQGLARILQREVRAATRRRAAYHLLDWLGCALVGASTEVGRIVAGGAARLGTGPCRAIGAGRRDAPVAAFVNGAYGNVLEMDDIHRTSILHPGPVVIPAALAAAEREDCDAASLLAAIVRGYEAVIRVGRSVGPGHYAHWHNTSTCGPFGAAAAVASILGLDAAATVWALGNAGTQSAGPWQCRLEDSMSKQLHTARAAEAGLAAAYLARDGFTGPAAILEGPLGFYTAMCPDPSPQRVTEDPDAPWLIEETSFKPWPACRHAHATIDAALALHAGVAGRAVDRVVVHTYEDALRYCDEPSPTTALAAKFSLQHCVAAVLAHGKPTLETFETAGRDEPAVRALRARVRVAASAPYRDAYPQHYGARVVVTFGDGREAGAEVTDALGDPENPLSPAAIEAKARMLMSAAGVDEPRRDAIVAAALALADGGTVAALSDRLDG